MKFYIKTVLLLILVLFTGAVYAQDFGDMELPPGMEEAETYIQFQADYYHFNNNDFENYDKETFEKNKSIDSENTDDALHFTMSTFQLSLNKEFGRTEFDFAMDRTGFWGNDNLMGNDDNANGFRFSSLHVIARPVDIFALKIGRFKHTIGDAKNDYFFNDIIDAVETEFSIPLGIDNLKIVTLAEVMSNAGKPSDMYAFSAIDKDSETIENFNGDTVSMRYGMQIRYFAATLFGYYVRYGANTSGAADTSEDGKSSLNESDKDYLATSGLRAFYTLAGFLSTDLTFAYSVGKDYQYEGEKDYNGFATALNVSLNAGNNGLNLPVLEEYVFSAGYFSPKYAGMKGSSPGGMLTFLYKGYFLAPYANFYHFKDYTKDEYEVSTVDSTVAKTFAKNTISTKVIGIRTDIDSVVFFANEDKDTVYSNVAGKNTKGEDGLTYMGIENDLTISYYIDSLKLYIAGGIFLPSDYYKDKSEVNTYFNDSTDLMYGVNVGCSYSLGI
jgi:hypothetical protein